MPEAVQFKLSDETTVLVSPPARNGVQQVGLGTHVSNATSTLRASLAPVTRAASEVIAEFRAGALHPEEIEVEFGVTLDAQLGAIISSAKASTHLAVRLRWSGGQREGSQQEGSQQEGSQQEGGQPENRRPEDTESPDHPSAATPPPPASVPAPSPPSRP
ncbi:CU044_2847 family protein [Streptomyces sp. NBC_00006]|uniref:CU044_2847 family protein n=1 Tax=unclassified Streptomyces TaxID=2593676 RepID=UPI002254A115|nr:MULTISPECIES: CU044_2847 family protein [unclassified Streptomyces]MCX5537310.1 CU044_2847 family protein [Streptomyces sp. NBC_00006]